MIYQIKIGRYRYGPVFDDDYGMELTADEAHARLDDVMRQAKTKFTYIYNFGDDWRHTFTVEKRVEPESGVEYPRCLADQRDEGTPFRKASVRADRWFS